MANAKILDVKLIIFSSILTFAFCLAIAFNISPFLRGPSPYPPEWQWSYQFINTLGRIWLPLIVGILGILGLFYFDDNNREKKKYFSIVFSIFIVFLTLFLQLSILYFSRAGVNVILERVINPGISGYFTAALRVKNIAEFLATYQNTVSHLPMRAADHPPFAVLFYSLIFFVSQHLQFLFPFVEKLSSNHKDIQNIWESLQSFQKLGAVISAIIIPILSSLVLIPLYFLCKTYYGKKEAVRSCFLYSFFPSVSLFLPINDVFLGIFGVLGMLGVLMAQKKKKIGLYIFSGIVFSIGIYFSVSMAIPMIMASIFISLSNLNVREKVLGGVGLLGGFVILPILLLFFNFNSFDVFVKITSLQAKRSYLPWVFYDLYDFFIFSGIPVLFFFVLMINKFLTSHVRAGDILSISFFIVLILLDTSGFSRAETGRIWMPYMPFLAIIVAGFLTKVEKISTQIFSLILILQLVQLLFMSEFWVTLW